MSVRYLFVRLKHLIPSAAVWLLILYLPTIGRAQPDSWLPLAVGNSWTYAGADRSVTITVEDRVTVLGRAAFRLVYDQGSPACYEEYLSWNAQGQLLLHGRKAPQGQPAVFDPPLVWFTPGLKEGTGGTVQVFRDFAGKTAPTTATWYVAYMGEVSLETPAGKLAATHVDELATAAEERWYAQHVGLVRLVFPQGRVPLTLVETNIPVAVENTSWSQLKATYR